MTKAKWDIANFYTAVEAKDLKYLNFIENYKNIC